MSESSGGGGIGIAGILTVVFVALKLLEVAPVASWSWIWVLAPLWIVWGTVFSISIIAMIIAGVGGWVGRRGAMKEFDE